MADNEIVGKLADSLLPDLVSSDTAGSLFDKVPLDPDDDESSIAGISSLSPLSLNNGEGLELIEADGLVLTEADMDAEGLELIEADMDAEGLELIEAEGLALGLALIDALGLALIDAEGLELIEALGLALIDIS